MNQPTESVLQFPCDFPIKAMGRGTDGFELMVVELVRRHAPDLRENAVAVRPSRNGRYLSVTVTVRATSQEQLDAIYRELSSCEAVLMAL